jgi:hypothetical protein
VSGRALPPYIPGGAAARLRRPSEPGFVPSIHRFASPDIQFDKKLKTFLKSDIRSSSFFKSKKVEKEYLFHGA